MLAFQLLLLAGILFLIRFLWRRRQFYMLRLTVPGPMGLPLLGVAVETILEKRKIKWRTKYLDKYGSTIFLWLGSKPVLITRDPDIIQDYLTSPENIYINHKIAVSATNYFGLGLMTLQGSQWSLRRKQLSPTFRHSVLLDNLPIINAKTNTLVTLLDALVGQGEKDVLPYLYRWSFGIATQTIIGSDLLEDERFKDLPLIHIYKSLLSMSTLNALVPLTRNKVIDQLIGFKRKRKEGRRVINSTIDKVIEEKIKLKPEDKVNSVINRVIELYQSGDLTYDEVRDECSSLIVVSFDTTALTVANTLILLAMHPEYQERVFNELKEVFPTAEDCELNEKHLKKLVYLERVVNETLRLIPTVPIDPRKTTQPLTLSNGVTIPKGLTIGIDLFHTHRNTDFWGPEASKFNPDNFLPANIQDRHPFAYLPFLKGRRTCLGWKQGLTSTQIAVARILRNYKLSTSFRYEDLVFVDNISIKLAKQPLLEFQRRN